MLPRQSLCGREQISVSDIADFLSMLKPTPLDAKIVRQSIAEKLIELSCRGVRRPIASGRGGIVENESCLRECWQVSVQKRSELVTIMSAAHEVRERGDGR